MPFIKQKEKDNLYSVVINVFPTTPELSQWKEEKFVELFEFCKLFISPSTNKWSFTKDRVLEIIAKYMDTDLNVYYKEFLYRINDTNPAIFRNRTTKLARVVGLYLHRNPAFITEKIADTIRMYPSFAWILENFEEKQMRSGAPMVMQTSMEKTDPGNNEPTKAKSTELMFSNIMYRYASLLSELSNSITVSEIKKMKTEKKLDALNKGITNLLAGAKIGSDRSKVFRSLDTHSESRQSLEKRLLDYAEETEINSEND